MKLSLSFRYFSKKDYISHNYFKHVTPTWSKDLSVELDFVKLEKILRGERFFLVLQEYEIKDRSEFSPLGGCYTGYSFIEILEFNSLRNKSHSLKIRIGHLKNETVSRIQKGLKVDVNKKSFINRLINKYVDFHLGKMEVVYDDVLDMNDKLSREDFRELKVKENKIYIIRDSF